MNYDCIVIGAGPAGVSLAVYLKRASLNVLVIYKDEGSLGYSTIENFYSYDSISGKDLFNKGLEQLKHNEIDVVKDEVLSITMEDVYVVETKENKYRGEYLTIATGLNRGRIPQKYKSFLGMGVSTCAFCDGPFYKKKQVYLTGKEPYLSVSKSELSYFTSLIEVINEEDIVSLFGESSLEGVVLKDGTKKELNNLFIALPLGASILSNNLGVIIDDKSNIMTDENMKTNIDKVYAIGDAIKGKRQVAKAVYDGMTAGYAIIEDKKNRK
ncbi:MAG: NAD(P)/FAD-dependent oxidoreductase [Gammaproteobacteria bacterium]|nr:NAD(P)/FAD-dependent oxidoreductase [Gammaproteobacteria bacterium]